MNHRADSWAKLSSTLHEVAARSFLVLAGDFNVTCRTAGRHAGCGVPKKLHPAEDWQDWMAILEAHALVALNTFGSAPSSTFRFGPRQSQLDYICVKLRHADALSKRATPLPACPIGRHISETAALHFPLTATLPRAWHIKNMPISSHYADNLNHQQLAHDVEHAPANLHLIRQAVLDWIPTSGDLCTDTDLSSLDTCLATAGHNSYPKQPTSRRSHWQNEVQVFRARDMWLLFRKMRAQQNNVGGIFAAWRCCVKYERMHRQYREHSVQLRKQKHLEVLQEATEAAERNDLWSLYKIVRRIVPNVLQENSRLRQINCTGMRRRALRPCT